MEIGNKIKALRLEKSVTQEQMASVFGVSAQAVCKWENGVTTPDIALLPELSVYFGVTIDELFNITDESHRQRIQNMILSERFLSQHDFDYAETYLTDKLKDEKNRADCLELLASLHNHRARGHYEKAARYAKEGMSLEPERKGFHSDLCEAERGSLHDWCISNHHSLINFYKDFVSKNPDCGMGYRWLIDNLIADGRLGEARLAADKIKTLYPGFRYFWYRGNIEKAAGNHKKALDYWNRMIADYPNEWCAQLCMGDCMALLCRYDEAVPYYRKAMELQVSPRFTDAPLSIAHIREIQGRYREAAEAMDEVLKILSGEWNITVGEGYEEPLRERNRYLRLAEDNNKKQGT